MPSVGVRNAESKNSRSALPIPSATWVQSVHDFTGFEPSPMPSYKVNVLPGPFAWNNSFRSAM